MKKGNEKRGRGRSEEKMMKKEETKVTDGEKKKATESTDGERQEVKKAIWVEGAEEERKIEEEREKRKLEKEAREVQVLERLEEWRKKGEG